MLFLFHRDELLYDFMQALTLLQCRSEDLTHKTHTNTHTDGHLHYGSRKNTFSYSFRFGGFEAQEVVCSVPSADKVSHASSCPDRCLQYPRIGRLLSLLQYELSGYICLCYSGTPNSIPLSCLILHNERLLAAHRIMSLSDSYDDVCIYFTHFDLFQKLSIQNMVNNSPLSPNITCMVLHAV